MLSQLWRNQTGIKRTDAILTCLIRLKIETGSSALVSLFLQNHWEFFKSQDQLQVISSIVHRDVSQRLPAFVAVLAVILSLWLKQNDFFVTPTFVLAKLYTNNLLMIFDSRIRIERGRNGWPSDDPSLVSFAIPSNSLALGSLKISNNVQTDEKKFCQECQRSMPSEKSV